MKTHKPFYMVESFRWFGLSDPVPLEYIRHTGASGVFTALHEIPYGEVWPVCEIQKRKKMIEEAGLSWSVVESVPVHENIKAGNGNVDKFLENYCATLRNLGSCGITTVVYNFMPVLDWVRTDTRYRLPDGTECLRFDPVQFAAFDIHALQRSGAEKDHAPETVEKAERWWKSLNHDEKQSFIIGIIDVFPGCKLGLGLEDIRAMIAPYQGIGRAEMFANLHRFLTAVLPHAERAGVRLAIHPDDPPFSVLGLPRIVSTSNDLDAIFQSLTSPATGLCFCSGSLSARPDNDVEGMAKKYAPRIHAAHLRSTRRESGGAFFEADHLGGSFSMPSVVRILLDEIDRRRDGGRPDWNLHFRPDHGHTMMDDLLKERPPNPGYTAIGRMRGLAEIRGVMHGLRYAETL
jgi:mannonate dehydratase